MTEQQVFTILVVDDEESTLRLIRTILEKEGYRVFASTGGEQALQLLEEHTPSLVLLDIIMPGMDGFMVCEEIRKRSMLPIIFLTGTTTEENLLRGLICGADDYIRKPFSPTELCARIRALLRRYKK